jgi:hypothetical protein
MPNIVAVSAAVRNVDELVDTLVRATVAPTAAILFSYIASEYPNSP